MAINRRQRPASATEMRKALRNAVEEDEQHAVEEEYRRAEERGQQLEEERRRAAEEGAHKSEEQRQQQEAETRELEEARRRKAEQRGQEEEAVRRTEAQRRDEAERQRREAEEAERIRAGEEERRRAQQRKPIDGEEARRQANLLVTTPAPTVRSQEYSSSEQAKPQPSMQTLKAPAPERVFSVGKDLIPDSRGVATVGESPAGSPPKNRTAMIVAAGLIGVVALVLIGWFVRGALNKSLPRTRTNQTGIEFVLVPAGSFMMGSTNGGDNEKPVHQVTISQAFYMGKYEVTQAQWQSVMGNNPSNFKDCGGNCPVEQVSWDDAQNFVNKLNESNDGFRYRLPTEAEWEYACRAGTTGDYAGDLDAMAWYGNNSGRGRLDAAEILRTDSTNYYKRITENGGQTHAVGTKLPNSFGLFDMHGNVWEWCQDWYHDSYNGAPSDGSAWLSGGEQKYRVLRGGSWDFDATHLRSALRFSYTPATCITESGFRVVAIR
jgi:formylglycine-generating enzyme required for sulfatase activity